MHTLEERRKFLEVDLYHALKELFVGAVAWAAADEEKGRSERSPFQKDLGMYASFVQARALYEFYFKERERPDDVRARHFGAWKEPKTSTYLTYMDEERSANKRIFHLVYGRSGHEPIKAQVVHIASDVRTLTEKFIESVEPACRGCAEDALRRALKDADTVAEYYGINNPLA